MTHKNGLSIKIDSISNSGNIDYPYFLLPHFLLFLSKDLKDNPKLYAWNKVYYSTLSLACISWIIYFYGGMKKTKSKIDLCNQEFVRDLRF